MFNLLRIRAIDVLLFFVCFRRFFYSLVETNNDKSECASFTTTDARF